MGVLRKRDSGVPGAVPPVGPGTDLWADSFPGIWELLTAPRDPEGLPRVGATLTIFASDGQVKLCCNERHTEETCFVTAASVGQALEALERGLQAGSVEWRRVKPWKGKKSK